MNRATRSEVVDAITTEVIRNKLEGIANEMELTLRFRGVQGRGEERCSGSRFTGPAAWSGAGA